LLVMSNIRNSIMMIMSMSMRGIGSSRMRRNKRNRKSKMNKWRRIKENHKSKSRIWTNSRR